MMNTIKELRKDEVLLIGVGLGGCTVVQNLHDKGYSCLFINSATGDLNNLIGIEDKEMLHYKGGDGAGGNRNVGKEYAEINMSKIFERIDKQYNSSKYIFVAFSTGGGTGSGGGTYIVQELYKRYSPFYNNKQNSLDVIPVKDRHVGCIAILPSEFDGLNKIGLRNSLECYKEVEALVEAKLVNAVMLLDNHKVNRLEINRRFAKDFDDLITITSRTDGTGQGIDSGDLVNALSGHGYLYMTSFNVSDKGEGMQIEGMGYMPEFVRHNCHAILATADIEKEHKSDMIMHNLKKYFSPADSISKIGYVINEEPVTDDNVNNANRAYGFGLNIPQKIKLQIQEIYNKEIELKQETMVPEEKIDVELIDVAKEDLLANKKEVITSSIPSNKPQEKKLSAREIAILKRMGKM